MSLVRFSLVQISLKQLSWVQMSLEQCQQLWTTLDQCSKLQMSQIWLRVLWQFHFSLFFLNKSLLFWFCVLIYTFVLDAALLSGHRLAWSKYLKTTKYFVKMPRVDFKINFSYLTRTFPAGNFSSNCVISFIEYFHNCHFVIFFYLVIHENFGAT